MADMHDSLTESNAVLAADDARIAAVLKSDTTALEQLLTADFTYIHSNGFRESREPYLERLKQRDVAILQLRRSDAKVRWVGNVALVEGTSTMRYQLRGSAPDAFTSLILEVWVRHDGRWQLSAYASTLQSKKPSA